MKKKIFLIPININYLIVWVFFPMNIWKFAISTTPHTYHTTSRRLTNGSTGRNPSSTGCGCTGNGIQPVEDNYCIRTKMAPKFSFTFIDSSYGIEEEDKENDFFLCHYCWTSGRTDRRRDRQTDRTDGLTDLPTFQ